MRTPNEIMTELKELYADYTDYAQPLAKKSLGEFLKGWFVGSQKETDPKNINFSETVEKCTAELFEYVSSGETLPEEKRQVSLDICRHLMDQPLRKKGGDVRDMYVGAMVRHAMQFTDYLRKEDATELLELFKKVPRIYMMPVQVDLKKKLESMTKA